MENNEDKLLEAIDQDVRSNAEMITNRVNEETNNLREDQISFYKEGLKKETDTYLESELNDLRLNEAIQSSRGKLETKKKLLELRTSLMNELFENVKKELKDFTKTPAYEEYLTKQLSKLQVTTNGYFKVRKDDVDLMQKVLNAKGLKNQVQSDFFAIGGFRYVDEEAGVEISCLLGDKQEEQLSWFRDHSGFKLKEGTAE